MLASIWGDFVDWVKEVFLWAFEWIIDLVRGLLSEVVSKVVSLIPDVDVSTTEVQEYLSVANLWVPINEGLVMLTAFLAIEAAVLTYRTIKKHIPTES